MLPAPKRRLSEPQLRVNGRVTSPVQLLEAVYAGLREHAAAEVPAFGGVAPNAVILTHPVSWRTEESLLETLRQAASNAGFESVDLLDEACAAAMAWLSQSDEARSRVVVLDVGGGTTDWVYLRRDGRRFEHDDSVSPGGLADLGSHDVDLALADSVMDIDASYQETLQAARRAKEFVGRGRALKTVSLAGKPWPVPAQDVDALCKQILVQPLLDQFVPW